ncbi:MAG: glycosyltransferase family 39 protein [Deltaproteobacteria bacterium]|nr:glycosyltransferase family 39 protein [Deltaproteobacteria bacterium]
MITRIINLSHRTYFLLLFALNIILRISSLYTPVLDVDETQFAGFAHVLMDGGFPFRDSLDTKPLGIYLFYWLCFALFGRTNMLAVHAMTTLVTFAAAVMLYRVFAVFREQTTGRWAALLFVIFSTTFIPKYISTSINSVMVIFLITSVYFMARACGQHKPLFSVLSGFVLGLGFLFKYTAGIQLVLFFLYSLYHYWMQKNKKQTPWNFLIQNILFGMAFILPFILHGLVLYQLGVWGDFVEWSLLGSGKYIGQGGATIAFLPSFVLRFGSYALATVFLWAYLFKGLDKNMHRDPRIMLCVLWFVLSLVPVLMSGRFYPHYFIHLLPALCGLAAIGIVRSENAGRHRGFKILFTLLVILPTLFFWGLRVHHRFYLQHFPDDHIYEQMEAGLKLREISKPDDRLFVWGFATGIYFYSGLKPASRFLWSDVLTGRTPGPGYARINREKEAQYQNNRAWEVFWEDINKQRPVFFVDTSPADIHDYERFPIKNYPALYSYVQERYTKILTFKGIDFYKLKTAL